MVYSTVSARTVQYQVKVNVDSDQEHFVHVYVRFEIGVLRYRLVNSLNLCFNNQYTLSVLSKLTHEKKESGNY